LADSAANLRLAVEEDIVRYVLEDGDDVYLNDLDGDCAPARAREANCLDSGFMIGKSVA